MSTSKTLSVKFAFGPDLANTFLLSAHPDETHDEQGDPLADQRTLVLKLQGTRAVLHEILPFPLVRAGYSASGAAYCGSVNSGTVHVWHAGHWTKETFSTKPVPFVRYVFAVPGRTPVEDTVFLATEHHVHIRQRGKWTSKRVPGEGLPYQMHGERPDEVFIGGPTLLLWDGKKLAELESPEDDIILGLAISADDRLIGGDTYVSASTPTGGWARIPTPVKDFFSFARFQDMVYALSTDHGVLRVYPGRPEIVTPPLAATALVPVGDGLIAIGDDAVFVYDGNEWTRVHIPTCEVGGMPA